jgi:signal transduction histidine kinase
MADEGGIAAGLQRGMWSRPWSLRGIWRGLAVILAVQLVYWLILNPLAFSPGQAGSPVEVHRAEFAKLDHPTTDALARAVLKPTELPVDVCCEPGYYAVRLHFTLENVPPTGLGLGPKLDVENFMVVVNGGIVYSPGQMEAPGHSFHGMNKRPIQVPAGVLRTGQNTADLIVTNTAIPFFQVRGVSLGEYGNFIAGGKHRNFMIYDYRALGGIIAGIIALLSLVLMFRTEDREFAFWLFVLAGGWSLLNLHYGWYDWPFGAAAMVAFRFTMLNLLPLAWLNLVDCWTGHGLRWMRWGLAIAFLAVSAVWGTLLYANSLSWYEPSITFMRPWAIALGSISVLRVAWHLATRAESRHWELALLILCLAAMIVDTFDDASFNVSNAAPILFLALAIAFFARNIRLFRSMNDINKLLEGQLREREGELAAEYARQEELARRETLVSERQRLMRDMHDGIGGQLMSLLFAARQKTIPRAELTEGLQAVIDELRLIIDSLDTVGESLGAALASFRSRIEPRLGAAGIRVEWTNRLPDDLPGLSPRAILHVFRIVQEAITNAIKHSGSKAIAIELGLVADDPSRLAVRVADHGKGISKGETNVAGRGIESMRTRAEAIGGTLDLASDPAGTTVTLCVPLEPAAA